MHRLALYACFPLIMILLQYISSCSILDTANQRPDGGASELLSPGKAHGRPCSMASFVFCVCVCVVGRKVLFCPSQCDDSVTGLAFFC